MLISLKKILEVSNFYDENTGEDRLEYCPNCKGKECTCEQGYGCVEESDASEKAKQLNLVHVGFGNYAQKEGGPILYRTIDGVLTSVGETEPAKDPKIIKKTGEEPETSREIEPPDVYGKGPAKLKKVGVTDVSLVDKKHQIYTFRYNNHPGRIKLSKDEIVQLAKTDVINIILNRINRKIARIKAQQKSGKEPQPQVPAKNAK